MKMRISSPTTDVRSARCVLKPIALFRATNSVETIQAEAMIVVVMIIGLTGIAIRMKNIPGAAEKNSGRASSQKPVFPWNSFVPTRKTVADQMKAAKSVKIMLAMVPDISWLGDRLLVWSPLKMLNPSP